MSLVSEEMRKRNLADLAKTKNGFQFTPTFFPYTSGKIGPYYVQSAEIKSNGRAYANAIQDMALLVKQVLGPNYEDTFVITGGETRDWIFSMPTAVFLKLPHTAIYKDGKMLGADLKGEVAAHIADLNNEGSSPRDLWVPAIKKAGGNIVDIFFYVDRMEHGVGVMDELGLRRHAMVELNASAWDYLKQNGIVSSEIYRNLQHRTENDELWAIGMLKSDKGLETLLALLGSEKTRAKGQKILNVGYPEIKEEVHTRLVHKFGVGVNRWLEAA